MFFVVFSRRGQHAGKTARYTVAPGDLANSIGVHMRSFLELYGPGRMIHKFHMALRFPAQLAMWGYLPNCTVLERKHKQFRRFADNVTKLKHFDTSVLREMTVNHLNAISETEHFLEGVGLVGAGAPTKRMQRQLEECFGPDALFKTARRARVNRFEKVAAGDVVEFELAKGDRRAGRVVCHANVQMQRGTDNFSVVSLMSVNSVCATFFAVD